MCRCAYTVAGQIAATVGLHLQRERAKSTDRSDGSRFSRTSPRETLACMRGVIIIVALGAYGLCVQSGQAAEPETQRGAAAPRVCLDPGSLASQPDCQATLDAALQSANDTEEEVVVTARSAAVSDVGRFRGAQPLQFQKRAPWVRRLERLGKEGIPFFRVPRGPDSEWVVGINRKGRLGFEMKRVNH
jgi:hypothetical protein